MTHLILAQANYLQKPIEFITRLLISFFYLIGRGLKRFAEAIIAGRQASANHEIEKFYRIEYPHDTPDQIRFRIANGITRGWK